VNDSSPSARRPGHGLQQVTHDDDEISIADLESPFRVLDRHRQRQLQRLSGAALVRGAYGVELGPLPPGPDVCPSWCPYCAQPAEAVVA
jgi:hypothetical protein